MAKLNDLRALFDPNENWKNYRTTLANAQLPALPYLGIYLQALTFSEDGNDTYLKTNDSSLKNKLVNWFKTAIISGIIEEILRFRSVRFLFKEVIDIKAPSVYLTRAFRFCSSSLLENVVVG